VNKHPNRSTKNKIRGVERLLKKADLAPAQRKLQEAQLAALQQELDAHAQSERERKFAVMYKKVRGEGLGLHGRPDRDRRGRQRHVLCCAAV